MDSGRQVSVSLCTQTTAIELHACGGRLDGSSVGKTVQRPNIPMVRLSNNYSIGESNLMRTCANIMGAAPTSAVLQS